MDFIEDRLVTGQKTLSRLADARRIIVAWRKGDDAVRPHSARGYLTPEEFEQLSVNGPSQQLSIRGREIRRKTSVALGK